MTVKQTEVFVFCVANAVWSRLFPVHMFLVKMAHPKISQKFSSMLAALGVSKTQSKSTHTRYSWFWTNGGLYTRIMEIQIDCIGSCIAKGVDYGILKESILGRVCLILSRRLYSDIVWTYRRRRPCHTSDRL
jgi:hypothetical protein